MNIFKHIFGHTLSKQFIRNDTSVNRYNMNEYNHVCWYSRCPLSGSGSSPASAAGSAYSGCAGRGGEGTSTCTPARTSSLSPELSESLIPGTARAASSHWSRRSSETWCWKKTLPRRGWGGEEWEGTGRKTVLILRQARGWTTAHYLSRLSAPVSASRPPGLAEKFA